jgi:hypothetical protein
MTARKLIKEIQRAIQESGESDLDVIINTKSAVLSKMKVCQTPIQQGETEIFVVIDTVEK